MYNKTHFKVSSKIPKISIWYFGISLQKAKISANNEFAFKVSADFLGLFVMFVLYVILNQTKGKLLHYI